jgi:hypothetical protein
VSEEQGGAGGDLQAGEDHEADLERTAERIAGRGRDALVARLRPAFREAASQHSDVLDLTDEQLEEMVQRAADRADGLQWRRALASIATDELGISLGEALGHPAVARAQELVGAPSYEESLAALTARIGELEAQGYKISERPEPEEEAEPEPEEEAEPEPEEEAEPEPEEEAEAEPEEEAEAEPEEEAEAEPEEEAEAEPEEASVLFPEVDRDPATAPSEEDEGWQDQATAAYSVDEFYTATAGADELRISVIHLGGIANLTAAEPEVELLLAEPGLDIIRGGGEVLGRLEWEHVRALEVPPPRRRLRRPGPTHLVIRTTRGDASFEVPGVEAEELRQHLAPILEAYLPAEAS